MTFACFPMKGLFRQPLNNIRFLIRLTVFGVCLSNLATSQMAMDIDHEMKANKLHPDDSKIVTCPDNGNNSLPAGDYSSNLHVVGRCIADRTQGDGIYKYHWVFVHDGGVLTFQDKKLDLYASSILVMNGGTLGAGTADDNGAITGPMTIHLWGASNSAAIDCEKPDGAMDATCGVDPNTWNSNKMDQIYPTTACKVDPKIGDCFYQYDDPAQSFLYFGRKVLAVSYGGTLQLFGKKGSTFDGLNPTPSNTGKSWTRLTQDLPADGTQLVVAGQMDWRGGDHLVISPTDYLPGHAEEAIIADSVYDSGSDTTTITINGVVLDNGTVQAGGVRFPHDGTAYSVPADIKDRLKLDRDSIDTRAAVGLLSRNIRIVSEGDTPPDTSKGTEPFFPPDPGNFFGGHVIFRQGFKQVQIQGVEFRQLGQGGLLGRYAVHFHMDRRVPADTFVKDCSMDESMTRWITIHGSQNILIARNVGWKSIGHGFFIEDGTETDNKLYANLGVLARAGVKNSQNPREVPGILANKDVGEFRAPFNSDWQHPSVFWIMNGWNDFEYNLAAGAGSCGMCYWLTAGANSGPSRYEYWTGYASRQRGLLDEAGQREFNAGTSPLQKFVGNSCSTAMFSFMELGNPDFTCLGFGTTNSVDVPPIAGMGPSVPQVNIPKGVYNYYPITSGFRKPTKCNDLTGDCGDNADLKNMKCEGSNDTSEKNCMVSVLDHYTTSFNWSEKNFSSIWMRNWWKLITDSAVTDQLGPGVTMVTGGGYTRSDNAIGNWLVGLRNVYVGQTQKDPTEPGRKFYASDLGPVTPKGIQCDNGSGDPRNYCLSAANGVSYFLTNFNSGQRMFNIYDGPSFQDSSAYLDIKARAIGDCTSQANGGVCVSSKYMYGHTIGLLQGTLDPNKPDNKECYIPNAAIAWKQENGFYYPPAFFSRDLVFRNVDIRHFVVEPLFQLNTFQLDIEKTKERYCTWDNLIFQPFNDIDRQTVLNDTDGSLTGLLANTTPPRETLSINEDKFFRAPNVVPECSSDKHYTTDQRGAPATAITSPYEYLTTAIIPDCVRTPDVCISGDNPCTKWDYRRECGVDKDDGQRNWTFTGAHVYGVPLFRQYWTAQDNAECQAEAECKSGNPLFRPGRITMMGQGTGQRSTLTANDSWYYIDTTVPASRQTGVPLQNGRSVFLSGHTYYVYLIYGTPTTTMKYSMYVGSNADKKTVEDQVGRYRVNVDSDAYGFNKVTVDKDNPDFLSEVQYDPMSGWLKVTVDMSRYGCGSADQNCEFSNDKKNFCKPVSYCSWNCDENKKNCSCGCAPGSNCKDDSVCAWGTQPPDCPSKGCFGFSFEIQPQFDRFSKPGPPMWTAFPDNAIWNVATKGVDEGTSGPECYYPPTQQ
jgi:hypothetical protein